MKHSFSILNPNKKSSIRLKIYPTKIKKEDHRLDASDKNITNCVRL